MKVTRAFFRDRYNGRKVWEVAMLAGGGFYLRQYINGKQFGRGSRTTKKHIDDIGIMEFEEIHAIK